MSIALRSMPQLLDHAIINEASTSVTAVAAVAGRKIVVWAYRLTSASLTSLTFKSGSTALTGPMQGTYFGESVPHVGSPSLQSYPHYETTAGEALVLSQASAIQLGGIIYYTLEA